MSISQPSTGAVSTFSAKLAAPFRWFGTKASNLARSATVAVANALQLIPNWVRTSFVPATFQRLAQEGYKSSSVVYACVTKYATAFSEPPLIVVEPGSDKLQLKHPVLDILRRPCPTAYDEKGRVMQRMSLTAWLSMVIIYMVIGGDCYLYKLRSADGRVVGLKPLHAGQMTPVMGKKGIEGYLFTKGDGLVETIAARDIIQISWPSIDPEQPWLSYPPLLAVAREVDTAAEAARYTYALFKNDAVPRTIFSVPAGLQDGDYSKFKARAEERFGGDNRGSIGVLRGDVKVSRIGLSLAELDSESALQVPEAHIASAFGIPAIILGLNIGLKRSTFANYREARAAFTEDTLCPLWRLVSDALTLGLEGEFESAPPFELHFDISRVVALRENQDVVNKQILAEWQAGTITRAEFRARRNYDALPEEEGNVYWYDVMKGAATPTVATEDQSADQKPTNSTNDKPDDEQDPEQG